MSEALLTMQDIADLAHVSRPAVSQWRKRTQVRGRRIPFPTAAQTTRGVEHFDRDTVVAWLRDTGRGNNVEFAEDSPALAVPPGVDAESVVTLLCLRDQSEEDLGDLSEDDRAQLAVSLDPTDSFLQSEFLAVDFSEDVVAFVDDLFAASFGAADALGRLESGRLKRERGERGFGDDLSGIVTAVVDGIAAHDQDTVFALETETGSFLPAAERLAGYRAPGDDFRSILRRAYLHGVPAAPPKASVIRVLSVHGMEDASALHRIDDEVLGLGPGDYAVVLGGAGLLCGRLNGSLEADRALTLRDGYSAARGRLAFALRLPRGLWKHAHRQSTGLWLLSGRGGIRRPWVADLVTESIDHAELAADVSGTLDAVSLPDEPPRRAFRYARSRDLSRVLAGESVVPPGVRAVSFGSSQTGHLDRVRAASIETAEPARTFDVLAAEAPGSMTIRMSSVGDLLEQKSAKKINGTRIAAAHADPNGSVEVLDAERGDSLFRLDPFDAEQLYPRAARTEPGDVVFTAIPPTAIVDDHGGSMVASPSRIIRLLPGAPIGPYTLAALINDQQTTELSTWQLPELARDQVQVVEEVMRDLQQYRSELRQKDRAARELGRALVEGVSAGTINLIPEAPPGREEIGR